MQKIQKKDEDMRKGTEKTEKIIKNKAKKENKNIYIK